MAVTTLFGQVTIGGDHSDNDPNYSWTTYDNYPGIDLTKVYQRVDVIAPHPGLHRNLQVTSLAFVVDGKPLTGANDVCFLPCPDWC